MTLNTCRTRTRLSKAAPLIVAACLALMITGCQTALDLRNEGSLALNRGQNQLAVKKLTASIDRNPSIAISHYYLGLAYLNLDRPLDARYALKNAHALRANNKDLAPKIQDALAQALSRQDNPDDLFAFLDEMVATYGTTRDYLRQAEYLIKAGDPDAAQLSLRKAAYFADPGDAEPYLAIADFYTSLNDQPNAITALKYANYIDPGNPDAADHLRQFGIVPGPTISKAPPKPALLR